MSTQQHHRSASHTASIVHGNADQFRVQQSAPPFAQSAARPPPPPASLPSIARSTKGYCRHCRSHVGDFYNSWSRITATLHVPVLLGSYSSRLKSVGNPEPAFKSTALHGCIIQPLSCPHPGCRETSIGFTVITTPAGKGKFRGRDLFDLGRIELQCEIAPGQIIVIEPREDTAPDLLAAEETPSPPPSSTLSSSSPNNVPNPSWTKAMEVDTRMPSLHQSAYSHTQMGIRHDLDRDAPKQHLMYPIEHDRQSRKQLSSSIHSPPVTNSLHSAVQPAPTKRPSIPSPAAEPIHHQADSPQQVSAIHPTGDVRESRGSVSKPQPAPSTSQTNGHQYPRSPGVVSMDAIERLQTQISQNSGALAAHTRDIRRGEETFQHVEESLRREFQAQLFRQTADIQKVEESAARLQHEMQGMRHAMEAISREMEAWRMDKQSRKSIFSPSHQMAAQDSALELMAQQIAVMSHKTSDLDNLKLHIEIMKNKIYRLEEGAKAASSQPPSHTFQLPREAAVATIPSTHAAVSSHPTTPTIPQASDASRRASNDQHHQPSFVQPAPKPVVEATPRTELVPSQSSGWTTVNAGVKRSSQSGMDSPQESTMHGPSSPKRAKLGEAEPFPGYTAAQPPPSRATVEPTDVRLSTPAHAITSQNPVADQAPSSQSQQQPSYSPYTPQYAPSDDSWRPDSQRMMGYRPRGRGRGGGGPGSRGGRVRKGVIAQPHGTFATPEWESDEWQSLRSSQGSPEDFHNHMARSGRGGIARRGSGGARGGYITNDRTSSLGLQGVTSGISFGPPGEVYGSAKRTRTKPVRNADGVLIRKDGRPDMRSQSSAANLRKVHARKENESSHSPTPTNIQYARPVSAADTPSPTGLAAPPNAADKHKAIMGKIFPEGLDASRKQHDYASQVFSEECDHTVHSRSHGHRSAAKTDKSVKKEQSENDASPRQKQSPQKQDVNMDRADSHAADEEEHEHEEHEDEEEEYEEGHEEEEEEEEEEDERQAPEQYGEHVKAHGETATKQAEDGNATAAVVGSRAGSENRAVESSVANDDDCIHVQA
ncbi:hypothetical protein COCMIDRAFT_104583 [Bipolaris oryzae ATCC 44560]|uniref:Uncharacterized protein n=1 Tax=Bipolaris oryzae ATCC 44560 TaxID=930090 RepID=W6Z2Y5_COCMI|nr:uncharacterized protein COCMIDRAFT_104583 [Bipolaris oryzae ATCC 44560]EUC42024.1 hypothetical protein COCMIDRAFT_104583 [Bipolaris oryzae ATCC 44560]